MARPRKYINRKLLKECCQAQLTDLQIQSMVGLKFQHLSERYGVAIKAWRAAGPGSMKHRLYTQGMSGNTAAMIFYLKNFAEMSDVTRDDSGIKGRGTERSHFASKPENASAVN